MVIALVSVRGLEDDEVRALVTRYVQQLLIGRSRCNDFVDAATRPDATSNQILNLLCETLVRSRPALAVVSWEHVHYRENSVCVMRQRERVRKNAKRRLREIDAAHDVLEHAVGGYRRRNGKLIADGSDRQNGTWRVRRDLASRGATLGGFCTRTRSRPGRGQVSSHHDQIRCHSARVGQNLYARLTVAHDGRYVTRIEAAVHPDQATQPDSRFLRTGTTAGAPDSVRQVLTTCIGGITAGATVQCSSGRRLHRT